MICVLKSWLKPSRITIYCNIRFIKLQFKQFLIINDQDYFEKQVKYTSAFSAMVYTSKWGI